MPVVKVYPKDKVLIGTIKGLNECLVHVQYLLANEKLSFMDNSSLQPMKRTLSASIEGLTKLVDPSSLDETKPTNLFCTKCEAEYPIMLSDSQHWEYCPKCGECFL